MANIKKMQMADVVCANPHLDISKAFCGLRVIITYTPTNSVCDVKYLEYSPSDGNKLVEVLSHPQLGTNGFCPHPTYNGNYRAELCLSHDRQFLAVQLLQYSLLGYNPVGETYVFEGDLAQSLSSLFCDQTNMEVKKE